MGYEGVSYSLLGSDSAICGILVEGKADAALAASLFHFKELEIREVKQYLSEHGIAVRM